MNSWTVTATLAAAPDFVTTPNGLPIWRVIAENTTKLGKRREHLNTFVLQGFGGLAEELSELALDEGDTLTCTARVAVTQFTNPQGHRERGIEATIMDYEVMEGGREPAAPN